MMQQHTIHIAGGVVRNPLVRLTEPVTLDFLAGEHIAIVGPNGAGKSLLVDMLTEKYPLRDGELTYDFSPSLTKTAYDNIKYIAFRDTYGSADANYYYQQRWNAHDQEDAPLVREVLGEVKDDVLRRQYRKSPSTTHIPTSVRHEDVYTIRCCRADRKRQSLWQADSSDKHDAFPD